MHSPPPSQSIDALDAPSRIGASGQTFSDISAGKVRQVGPPERVAPPRGECLERRDLRVSWPPGGSSDSLLAGGLTKPIGRASGPKTVCGEPKVRASARRAKTPTRAASGGPHRSIWAPGGRSWRHAGRGLQLHGRRRAGGSELDAGRGRQSGRVAGWLSGWLAEGRQKCRLEWGRRRR